jgi:hypothetical protein
MACNALAAAYQQLLTGNNVADPFANQNYAIDFRTAISNAR